MTTATCIAVETSGFQFNQSWLLNFSRSQSCLNLATSRLNAIGSVRTLCAASQALELNQFCNVLWHFFWWYKRSTKEWLCTVAYWGSSWVAVWHKLNASGVCHQTGCFLHERKWMQIHRFDGTSLCIPPSVSLTIYLLTHFGVRIGTDYHKRIYTAWYVCDATSPKHKGMINISRSTTLGIA